MKCPHCDTHIDEHEALRCLDAWVAEAVMDEILTYPYTVSPHNKETGITLDVNLSLSYYSTAIAAAWEVVEKLIDDRGVKFIHLGSTPWKDKWLAEFYGDFPRVERAPASSAPLAICRAAIKAIIND